MTTTTKKLRAEGSLDGWWFLSWKKGELEHQGQIVRKDGSGYEVQLYEWAMGEPSKTILVRRDDMRDWTFYPRIEWQKRAAALADVDPGVIRKKRCPRCDSVGDVHRATRRDSFTILWYRNEEFWSCDTCVSAEELEDGRFGCGYDSPNSNPHRPFGID